MSCDGGAGAGASSELRRRACSLNDEDGCVSLAQVLRSFGAPISEAWAWALAHEACRALQEAMQGGGDLFLVRDAEEMLLHSSGMVHQDSYLRAGEDRQPLLSENKAVSELGLVLYWALDFGLGESEQRTLSKEIEELLEAMVGGNNETDDEGIACDDDEENSFRISGLGEKTMELCASQLSAPGAESGTHFRNVCRAIVSEALELSSFMEKVTVYQEERDEELRALCLQDWARLWVQCMHDLRNGVKLKKTNFTKTPVEYELTPYEMLMDDIRSRRYKLNRVMVDGEAPATKAKARRDAHDVILEFIRSRPPLRPAENRELAPLKTESTPVELLMESIRNSNARSSLRKTAGPRVRKSLLPEPSAKCVKEEEEGEKKPEETTETSKQLLMINSADLSTLLNFNTDAEDDGDATTTDAESRTASRHTSRQTSREGSATLAAASAAAAVAARGSGFIQPHKPRKLYVKSDSPSDTSRDSSSASTTASSTPVTSGRNTPVTAASDRFGGYRVKQKKEAKHGGKKGGKEGFSLNTPQMHASLQSELLKSRSVRTIHEESERDDPTSSFIPNDDLRRPKIPSSNSSLAVPKLVITDPDGFRFVLEREQQQETTTSLCWWQEVEMKLALSRLLTTMTPRRVSVLADKASHGAKGRKKWSVDAWKEGGTLPGVEEKWSREHWSTALKTLDLNLDEVIHIRTVLTRAELEGLPLEGTLRNDVEKGKICFLCMKTRFSFFTWGVRCQLCKQQVCAKCSSKMRVPLEHFSAIPASALSARPMMGGGAVAAAGSNTLAVSSSMRRRKSFAGGGGGSSAPNSPEGRRKAGRKVGKMKRVQTAGHGSLDELCRDGEESCDEEDYWDDDEYEEGEDELDSFGPVSLPFSVGQRTRPERKSFGGYVKRTPSPNSTSNSSSNRLQVCSDCRQMILQVVRAQRTAQRMQLTRQLYGATAVAKAK